VNDGTNDRVADTYKGWLLEKRTYDSDAYLTHLDDQGPPPPPRLPDQC